MTGVVQNQSKVVLNNARVANAPFTGAAVGLVKTTYLGPWDATAGNAPLADEAAWTGYSRQSLTSWSGSILTGDNHAQSGASVVSFGNSSGSDQQAAGWFYYDNTNSKVFMLGQFAAPVTIPDGGSLPFAPFWRETGE